MGKTLGRLPWKSNTITEECHGCRSKKNISYKKIKKLGITIYGRILTFGSNLSSSQSQKRKRGLQVKKYKKLSRGEICVANFIPTCEWGESG